VLYRFIGGSDGRHPWGALVAGAKGALYGTTNAGGQYGYGTVFKLTPSASGQTWTETVLYSFCKQSSCDDGSYPEAGLVFDEYGALYGTTSEGGAGYGTVFKLTPPAASGGPWTETVLYAFAGGIDGSHPAAGLIFDKQGALYGTTSEGGYYGTTGYGTVFQLTPNPGHASWRETQLHRFCFVGYYCTDGKYPLGGLVFGPFGALYGTTSQGGSSGGTDDCGNFLTLGGCGVVFQLFPGAGYFVIHNFTDGVGTGALYGAFPQSDLIFGKDGALYGTTGGGASLNGQLIIAGTAFKLTPPAAPYGAAWTSTTVYNFDDGFCTNCVEGDSEFPNGLIADADGVLYGTAPDVDPTANFPPQGSVFKLTRDANGGPGYYETILHYFPSAGDTASDGAKPLAALIFGKDGALYGTTLEGGGTGCIQEAGCGTVFKITK
jgi:uncharacterized repeat protein (TIGR03803 family)